MIDTIIRTLNRNLKNINNADISLNKINKKESYSNLLKQTNKKIKKK